MSVGQQQAPHRRGGQRPLPGNTEGGRSPVVAARLSPDHAARLIELAGPARGAVSEFIRSAIEDAIERVGEDAGES